MRNTYQSLLFVTQVRVDDVFVSLIFIDALEPGAWFEDALFSTPPCPSSPSSILIGRTMFETSNLPDGWGERTNRLDMVWVPTSFQKGVFEKGGVEGSKIHVIGEAVDPIFLSPPSPSSLTQLMNQFPHLQEALEGKETVFLSVFKWEKRKGWDLLLKSYFSTFSPHSNTLLIIVTSNYHSNHNFYKLAYQIAKFLYPKEDDIESVLPEFLILSSTSSPNAIPQSLLPSLYSLAHAVVLPTRGEGF